jgi:predicted kinase
MRKHRDFVWNATNITVQLRKQLIDLFTSYGGEVTIVYVEVPHKTMITQNASREDEVPRKVIDRMINKLEIPNLIEAHNITYFVLE